MQINMNRVTVSLPNKLKEQTNQLIKMGYFASFSDAVRAALRKMTERNKYEILAEEAKRELKSGRAIILKDQQDIDKYLVDK